MERTTPRRFILRASIGCAAVLVALLAIFVAMPSRASDQGHRASGTSSEHKGDNKGDNKQSQDCAEVAKDQLAACRSSARDDYWIAIAHCDNDPGEDAQGLCPKAAKDDFDAALSACSDQLDARRQVCQKLGGGKYNPVIDPANFVADITNPYYPLKPGTTFVYEGDTADGRLHDEIQVTHDTRTILGVPCIVVRDVSTVAGSLSEDTTDWFAQDAAGNVWYFGEEAKQYADGVLVGIDGSWMAGVNGALPGIVMEASPKVGDVYRQEFAISEAEDTAQVIAFNQSASVPYGSFSNALETFEFSGLEPASTEHKFYVSGVGFILSVDDQTGEREELIGITN